MFARKIESFINLVLLVLLLAACGGREETSATAVPTTPAPQPTNTATAVPPTETAVPPTETPIPPTATAVPPTPVAHITLDFVTYMDSSAFLTFQYPVDWEFIVNEQAETVSFMLLSSKEAAEYVQANDYSQPFAIFTGENRWFRGSGTADPAEILTEWVTDPENDIEPIGEMTSSERGEMHLASQPVAVTNADGGTIELQAVTIVNGRRIATIAYSVSETGQEAFGDVVAAILASIQVNSLEQAEAALAQTSAILLNPDASFTGEMAVIIQSNYQYRLAVMDMATGRIGSSLAEFAVQPAWRPGYDSVSYTASGDIYLTAQDQALLSEEGLDYHSGSWSRDGRYLAFAARISPSVDPAALNDIYVADFGMNPPKITRLTEDSGNNTSPTWSRDGSFIFFISDRDRQDYEFALYMMMADGSHQIRIVRDDSRNYFPAVSPDGLKVAFVSSTNEAQELFVLDIVTNQTRQLTNQGLFDFSPTWSPDGAYIAYLANVNGIPSDQYQLYVIPADGSSPPIPYSRLLDTPISGIAWRQELPGTAGFANPASVLQAIFQAAQTGDYSQLAGLCDPLGETDVDTAVFCQLTPDHEYAAFFEAWFATGQIVGEPVINGNRAEVTFTIGPDGDQEEMMTLIQRDGRWYLLKY